MRHNQWLKLRIYLYRQKNVRLFSFLLGTLAFLHLISQISHPKSTSSTELRNENSEGIVVSYAYKDGSKVQRENLKFFLSRGLTTREDVHFVFTLNDAPRCSYQELIPRRPNIDVVCRKNTGFDTCAHSRVINSRKFQNKKYFVILNGSTRGPFSLGDCVFVNQSTPTLHQYCISEGRKKINRQRKLDLAGRFWVDRFINLIENSRNRGKLAGAYISCEKAPHVQSWLAVAHRDVLEDLKQTMHCFPSQAEAIEKGEIYLSTSILNHGFNILSAIKDYERTDFRAKVSEKFCRNHNPGTALGFCPYGFCRSLHPLETIFFKNSGGIERDNVIDKGLEAEINYLTYVLGLNVRRKKYPSRKEEEPWA